MARINQETPMREKKNSIVYRQNGFDLASLVRLVPPFNKDDNDKDLHQFEKIVTKLSWPLDVRPTLLQKAVYTKSQDSYADLSIEDSADYKMVKAAILKTCELVSEA